MYNWEALSISLSIKTESIHLNELLVALHAKILD